LAKQLELFPTDEGAAESDRASTFADNLSQPVHRWFRYSAGFSAPWVEGLIEREKARGRRRVLDPFAGSGTSLLAAECCDIDAIGIEAHPFVARIAQAKLCWRENPKAFCDYANLITGRAKTQGGDGSEYPPLIQKCFPPAALSQLDALRKAWEEAADNSPVSELVWLALVSILRECSPVVTAQWQYVLPNKTKAKIVEPYVAFAAKVRLMSEDMEKRHRLAGGARAILYREDARECAAIPAGWADLVITSPPYANNYDYADATRLEMSFFGQVRSWGDLQNAVRRYLIRSCTQHAAKLNKEIESILSEPVLEPIRPEIAEICSRLAAERENHGGKKPYHTMIAAYFSDMAKVWLALRRVTAAGALVCFVVGDSAPYGIYVPADRWLGELAVAAGFKGYKFDKIRDRNVKWLNRKHRLPLQEGLLSVEG
jgi:hypothetical protein